MTGPRGYYRFPWTWSAAELLAGELASGRRSFAQIARELRERRLVERRPDKATVRRAVLRLEVEVAHAS